MAHLIRQSVRENHGGSLWQGGATDVMSGVRYDLIVLCAEEFQPEAHLIVRERFPNDTRPEPKVLYAPNDDSENPLTRAQLTIAIGASRVVAKSFREGKKVLVSCMQGRNRSGLVTALALHRLYGMAGERCRGYIRARIPHALTNPSFNKFLDSLKARAR